VLDAIVIGGGPAGLAETSVPGVFAAGDVVPGYQLVQVAAAKGTTAGIGCAESLRPERAPGVDL
jgi:thioredoxin reductase